MQTTADTWHRGVIIHCAEIYTEYYNKQHSHVASVCQLENYATKQSERNLNGASEATKNGIECPSK